MEMRHIAAMAVGMKVDALAYETAEDVATQPNEHDTDAQFQVLGNTFRHDAIQSNHHRADGEQHHRVAETPGGGQPGGGREALGTRCQGGDGGDMIRLDGVPQSDHETQE